MSRFTVTWEIDVEADSPEDAARQARKFQLDETAEVGYFTTVEILQGYKVVRDVDLNQTEENPE